MQVKRENRLAVFEHVPPKKPSPPKTTSKFVKRSQSPEPEPQHEETAPKSVKRAKRGIYVAEDELVFVCECDDCDYSTKRYYDFLKHLVQHVDEKKDDLELGSVYSCTWSTCDYVAPSYNFLQVHVTYHGYHTRLKAIGRRVLTKIKLPECNEPDVPIPALPECYVCEWTDCNLVLYQYSVYVDHIKCHVNALPKKISDGEGSIRCGWAECPNVYSYQYKLLDHLRCHTKEKTIACPTCGVMFSCRTKFYDHRRRQLASDLQGYQCSQCSKLFASERLLRDHMRMHINHFKCHLCDMTCTRPSALAKHIRFRHLPERPFRCDLCKHSTITSQDLARHKETHMLDKKLECKECEFSCRSKNAFVRHMKRHAGKWGRLFACHCCDKRFTLGATLTKHLITKHDFHWPSGHSRFSYKEDAKTGLYHLQVVRYESLEVTQEMMQSTIPYQLNNAEDIKFECVQNKNQPKSFVLKLAATASNNEDPLTPDISEADELESLPDTPNINYKKDIASLQEIEIVEHPVKVESVKKER